MNNQTTCSVYCWFHDVTVHVWQETLVQATISDTAIRLALLWNRMTRSRVIGLPNFREHEQRSVLHLDKCKRQSKCPPQHHNPYRINTKLGFLKSCIACTLSRTGWLSIKWLWIESFYVAGCISFLPSPHCRVSSMACGTGPVQLPLLLCESMLHPVELPWVRCSRVGHR